MEPLLLFYGSWILNVTSKGTSADMNIVVWDTTGTPELVGIYEATVGASFPIDRPQWQIDFGWTTGTVSHSANGKKVGADFLSSTGLVVTLAGARDNDFSDLVVQCRSLDPEIDEFVPITNLPDFTYRKS